MPKTRHYRFTYVTSGGLETGPSKVLSVTEGSVAATSMNIYNVPREGLLDIHSRKIYRSTETTSASPATSTYNLVSTVASNDMGNYEDSLADLSGATAMPTSPIFIPGTSGAANIVAYGAVSNADTASSAIENFPAEWYRAVILFAAKRLCDAKLMDMRAKLAVLSDSSDTTHSAPAEASQGWEKVRYYIEDDEDVELASAKSQAMGAEQAQFALDYKWLQGQRQIIAQEYDQMFQFEGMTKEQK